jgi:MFS family permease
VVLLPSIGDELGADAAALGWIVNAFALASATPVLALGRVADLVGRRKVLLAGMVVFGVSSAVGGLAPSAFVLIAARAGQGVGTACFFTASLATVDACFPVDRRALAIGLWGGIGGLGSAVGPLVGGAIGQWLSWRWFFALSIPIMAVAVPLTLRFVPETRDERSRTVDIAGFVLVTFGLFGLIGGLQQGASVGLDQPLVVAAIGLGAALLAGFVWWELRAPTPMVRFSLFRDRAYLGASGVALLGNWGFGVAMFFITIYVQDVLGEDPLTTGMAFIAFSVPFAALGALSGPVQRLLGGPRAALAIGQVLVGAGFVVWLWIAPGTGLTLVMAGLAVGGLGQALVFNVSNSASLSRLSDDEAGVGSGMVTTLRSVGLAAGVAVTSLLVPTTVSEPASNVEVAAFDGALRSGILLTFAVTTLGLVAALVVPRGLNPPRR